MKRLAATLLVAVAGVAAAATFAGAQPSASPARNSLLRTASGQMPGGLAAQAPIRRVRVIGHGLGLGGAVVQSANWAGHDVTGGGFSSVSASWTQPTIQPDGTTDSLASFWVGLDGDGSNTVEQLGTQAENYYGSVTYSAWWEIYPDYEVPIPTMTISPGDVMTAAVSSDGLGNFTLALTDHTTGGHFTTTQHSAVAQRYSAEIIAEAPTNGQTGQAYPLPEFGRVDFISCTIDGQPISAFAHNQIDMVSQGGVDTLAATSPLGADGASFSVTSHPGTVPAPTLGSFTPTSGPVGSVVAMSGTGLSGATAVSFSGAGATSFHVNSDTQISATVPAGAISGPISVTTPGGLAVSVTSYTVTAPAPKISRLSPTSGKRGATITITGAHLGTTRGTNFVTFGAAKCTRYLSWSATRIKCRVPAKSTHGKVKVTVTTAAGKSKAVIFTVKR